MKHEIHILKQSAALLLPIAILFTGCTQTVMHSAAYTTHVTAAVTDKRTVPAVSQANRKTAHSRKRTSARKSKRTVAKQKKLIAIDPGHQSRGNNAKEPIGPGASVTKPMVSSGTQGVVTRVPEYKLNLVIAKKVKKELLRRGYRVFMIRETNHVNISNKKRAEMATKSKADIFIRIHADSSTNASVNGTSTLYPSKSNPYVSYLSRNSKRLSEAIVNSICKSTSSNNRGSIASDNMSGINWCTIPVSIIEMGFMSNPKEDRLMQSNRYQAKLVNGICNGIEEYFK